MKPTFKNYYVIQDTTGGIVPSTLSYDRKSCISKFLEGGTMTWKETTRYGWKCLKVNVNFEIL